MCLLHILSAKIILSIHWFIRSLLNTGCWEEAISQIQMGSSACLTSQIWCFYHRISHKHYDYRSTLTNCHGKGPQWNPMGSCPSVVIKLQSPYRYNNWYNIYHPLYPPHWWREDLFQSWRRQIYLLQVPHLFLWYFTWFITGRSSIILDWDPSINELW